MKALLSVLFSEPLVRPELAKSYRVTLHRAGEVAEQITIDPASDVDGEFVADLETPVDLGESVEVGLVSVGRFQESAPVIVAYRVPESLTPGEPTEAAVIVRDVVEEPEPPPSEAPEPEAPLESEPPNEPVA